MKMRLVRHIDIRMLEIKTQNNMKNINQIYVIVKCG